MCPEGSLVVEAKRTKCDLSRGVSGVRGRPEGNLSLVSPILSRTFLLGKVSELC